VEKPTVVVIDDDVTFLEELEEVLCSNGYSVESVSDPMAAVQAIRKAAPDAVLLDLKMDEKDGFDIATELSHDPTTASIPVIAMTAHYSGDELERLKGSGVVRSFLMKPLVIADVMAKLDEVRGPGGTPEA
jgi:chemosensory pili system protein ChpA (sensor histidine kinase/response regulator)